MQDYYGTGLRERDLDGGQVMQMITHLLQVWEVHRIHMNIQLPEVVSLTSALNFYAYLIVIWSIRRLLYSCLFYLITDCHPHNGIDVSTRQLTTFHNFYTDLQKT